MFSRGCESYSASETKERKRGQGDGKSREAANPTKTMSPSGFRVEREWTRRKVAQKFSSDEIVTESRGYRLTVM